MAQDTFTEVTRQGWGSRLGGSLKGILVGFVLVGAGIVLLFFNEGRAVKRAKALDHGSAAVVSVAATSVDPANEGKLVHLTGTATTDEILMDPEFAISAQALHLRRNVEMYQWEQTSESKTEKKVGGATETTTTYSYRKAWLPRHADSTAFKQPAGHENPASMPFHGRDLSASSATIGAYRLSPSLIGRISNREKLPVTDTSAIPAALSETTMIYDGGFYQGDDPTSPRIGDVRVGFEVVRPSQVSVAALQTGGVLGPWTAPNGQTVELLTYGAATPEQMFESAHQSNKVMTWILRLVGFILIMTGINAILRPFSVMADVIPAIGNLVARGTGAIAFFLAGFLAFLTIGLAWLFYRPLLGITLLALALGAIVIALKMAGKTKAARVAEAVVATPKTAPTAAGPPPPPPPPPPAD